MSLYGRIYAVLYHRTIAAAEREGFADMTRELLGEARGRVLEIGAGGGRNLPHYPGAVDELVLAEPDPDMARVLHERVSESDARATVVHAPAERLPFDDASFDTVVSTLVLCTVDDPAAALAEIARVLRPGARLLVLEHVRSAEPRLARWQDRAAPAWKVVNRGCHCNRDTLAALREAGFDTGAIESREFPKQMFVVRPMIAGAVTPAR